MRLDNDSSLFQRIITNAADSMTILEEYVEKDYWLVLILKNIFQNDNGYVFKGGTSLSKCYHLINRFSEDIDISYSDEYNSAPITEINRKFKGITKAIQSVGLEIENKDKLKRSAYFNRFSCPYDSLIDGKGIEKKVIIELAAQTPSFPSNKMTIQSFIGKFFEENNRHDLVEKYELESFEINVQSLERTIIDKTFAICDYYLENKPTKHSRHLYDIYKILPNIKLDPSLVELISKVRQYRKRIPVCHSAKDGVKLREVLKNIIDKDYFKEDYESTTYALLYDKINYSSCKKALEKLQTFLEGNNL